MAALTPSSSKGSTRPRRISPHSAPSTSAASRKLATSQSI